MLVVLVAGILGLALYRRREHRIELLYFQAAGYPPLFRSTEQSQAATRELATYRGEDVTQKLLAIAEGGSGIVLPQNQTEAIQALAMRDNPAVSVALADLLQPSEPYQVRVAAASALQRLPCDAACISEILHYLERVWQGELNVEERTTFPAEMGESIKSDTEKDEATLYGQLLSLLQREHVATLRILVRTYGLGTVAPSRFALMVVSRAGFRDVCPLLKKDETQIAGTEKWFTAPRDELNDAIQTLNCQ